MKTTPIPTTAVRIPPDIVKALDVKAKKLDRTRSWLIVQALRESLEKPMAGQTAAR